VRSPLLPVVLPLAALIASLVRWLVQGSGNLYTALEKRFYVPDPVTEWRVSTQTPIWLGLEVCAIIAALAIGLAVGAVLIKRRERRTGQRATILRAASWLVAVVPLAVPIAAFAGGPGPARGVDLLPPRAAVNVESGIEGKLSLSAGTYELVPGQGSAITAKLSAGGEAFDAVFTGDLRGSWRGNPQALDQSMNLEISVATASVDTGIAERSKHARESYLLADRFPKLTFRLEQLIASRQISAEQIAFRATGTVELIGKTHPVEVTGTAKRLDATEQAHLGTRGEVMRVAAQFSLVIADTALAPDQGDFDGDRIPVQVSLVLRHTQGAVR
jgi:polyisoprenoid-binding protein YceI